MVKHIQKSKLLNFDIVYHLVVKLSDVFASNGHCKASCQQWKKLHLLSLVVNELHFIFLAADVSELSSDSRVSQRNQQTLGQINFGSINHNGSNQDHG